MISSAMRYITLILFVILLCFPNVSKAQTDPVLAAMITSFTDKAKRNLRSETQAMSGETTGHIWIREEVEATTSLQKEFNDYLDSFRGVIIYAAQVYGFYSEINRLIREMEQFSAELDDHPANAIAVALSPKRNDIYKELIMSGLDIVNDIRLICLSGSKMTERERIQIVFDVRPKLKKINKKLRQLTKAVKYTSLNDVWLEVEGKARPTADKAVIVERCHLRWKERCRIR